MLPLWLSVCVANYILCQDCGTGHKYVSSTLLCLAVGLNGRRELLPSRAPVPHAVPVQDIRTAAALTGSHRDSSCSVQRVRSTLVKPATPPPPPPSLPSNYGTRVAIGARNPCCHACHSPLTCTAPVRSPLWHVV
jgi:hypothetical protein